MRLGVPVLILSAALPVGGVAQLPDTTRVGSVLRVQVLTAAGRIGIDGAEVAIRSLGKRAVADSIGWATISGIPAGAQTIDVRSIGYLPGSVMLTFDGRSVVDAQYLLKRVTTLETVNISASAIIPSFEDNRAVGLGQFLTRADLAKMEGRKLGDILTQMRGAAVVRGRGYAWLGSSRGVRSLGGSVNAISPEDGFRGAKPGCYAQVYLDQVLIYASRRAGSVEPLFDLNSVSPEQIESVEYYSGPATTPMMYSRMNSTCGVLVIHSRRFQPKAAEEALRKPPL